ERSAALAEPARRRADAGPVAGGAGGRARAVRRGVGAGAVVVVAGGEGPVMFMTSSILAAIRWEMPAMAPMAVAAFALLLAGVLWLYPPQLRRRSRFARWLLPALRTLAALAVVASVLRPVVVRRKPPGEQQGAVVLLIDGSRSMNVVDRGRTKAD